MITYKSICEKLGFDPITDDFKLELGDHEDDSKVSPFSILSFEELKVFSSHLIANRDKLERYMAR